MEILQKGLSVHYELASAEIRPLHQLMEDMFIKMVDNVRNMVCWFVVSVCFIVYVVVVVVVAVAAAAAVDL